LAEGVVFLEGGWQVEADGSDESVDTQEGFVELGAVGVCGEEYAGTCDGGSEEDSDYDDGVGEADAAGNGVSVDAAQAVGGLVLAGEAGTAAGVDFAAVGLVVVDAEVVSARRFVAISRGRAV
jgi:hypothetical protein